ncbi:hypothetical protein Phum_PHUM071410 [Pediculus humanus corporis]|uniref:Uncharacterized protein n=1 Tax=Pediculus humanus subsp. corporis TaxID=121224 RepID=E0VBU4_PEDHC|nr:uncharacterized protein Phum_PHUM071410 [Pediculus humanus corporis]EEB10850.1 hypothetical protein Phum_PHUM071410 [Pediculus humanus corporis]
MESQDKIIKIEEKYKAEIAEMKARFITEKEELTTLFLEKLKEVENYHKKMLQDLVIKSNTDLDAIQSKHEEKLSFISGIHNKEIEGLQCKIDELLTANEELKNMLTAIKEDQKFSKENIVNLLESDINNS